EVREPVERGGAAVEGGRGGEAEAGGGGVPRVRAAEAEADGEDRPAPLLAQEVDRGADVGLDPGLRRLVDVLAVLEVVVSLRDARRAAEGVDRNRAIAALREAQCQLLVESVEAAHVR